MCGSRSGSKKDDSGEQNQITRAEERALHVCCIVTEARARFAPDVRIEPEIGGPKPVQGCVLSGGLGARTSCIAGSFRAAAKEGSDFMAESSL